MGRASDRLHPGAGNLVLFVAATFVALLAGELVTRLLAPQPPTPAFIRPGTPDVQLFALDSVLGMVLKPAVTVPYAFGTVVRTNTLGLRDREYRPKDPGEFRVLSLGDSYAFGYGVELEQSYGKLLERQLSHEFPERRFSVINAGVSGYGTKQQTLSFRRLYGPLQPDFVLATFTAGNDVKNNAEFEEQRRTGMQTPMSWLGRNSNLVRLVLKVTFPAWYFMDNRDRGEIEHTIALLKELEGDLRDTGIPYLMLVIPARHQIRPEVEPGARMLLRLGLDELVFRQNRSVTEHFRRDNVPYLDLWPALVAQDSTSPVSFTEDMHLNPLGHAVVAKEIAAKLQEMLPPPGALPRQ
jgi:lysophospholipase L1-like esterase